MKNAQPHETGTPRANDDVHLVPVFRKDLTAVFRLLAERNSEQYASGGSVASILGGPEASWSEGDLGALFGLCRPVHRAILSRMAEAGTKHGAATYEELRTAGAVASKNPKFNFDNMRGNLAWISKYTVKVKGSTAGPFSVFDKGAGVPTGERYEYRMPKTIADVWLRMARAAVSAFDVIPPVE